MTNAELLQKIKAEIERLYNGEAPKHDQQCNFDDGYFVGIDAIAQFLDSLESEKPMSLEEEIKKEMVKLPFFIRGKDQIAFARHFAEWGYLRAAEKYNEIEYNRQRAEESEKPMQDELEKEMDEFFETMPVLEHENIFEDTFKNIARHFAQWQREQMMREAVEGEISSVDVGDDSYVKTLKISELQKAIRNYNLGDKVRIIVLPKED